ncbi:MAG TPA: PEP-CTERM sorting domain-containing protein [Caulobacteraceae bacterium]|nr:PEP-CTERM sorting domain-containing protein [Caulobacteraceae bacterium]
MLRWILAGGASALAFAAAAGASASITSGDFTQQDGPYVFTVPAGAYAFTIAGGEGGASGAFAGAPGAEFSGRLTFLTPTTLTVIVGQAGYSASGSGPRSFNGAGGGGGTFVFVGQTPGIVGQAPVVAAGGGGGAVYNAAGTNGFALAGGGLGAQGGGAYANTSIGIYARNPNYYTAAGGGGAGVFGPGGNGAGTDNHSGGYSFAFGFGWYQAFSEEHPGYGLGEAGGFGGGGGGGYYKGGGGGGGGYSGGAGGDSTSWQLHTTPSFYYTIAFPPKAGGSGTSHFSGLNSTQITGNAGDGFFEFSLVPEPSSWALALGGAGMIGGALRWRRALARSGAGLGLLGYIMRRRIAG